MAVPEDRLRLRSHLQVTQRRHPLHPGGRGHKDLRLIVAEPMVLGAQKRVAARQARGAAVPAVAVGGGGVAGVEPEHRRELASRRSGGAALEPPGPAGVWCLRGHRVVLVVIVPLHSTQPHLQLCRSTAIRGGAQAILLLAHGTGEPAACLRGDRRKALLAGLLLLVPAWLAGHAADDHARPPPRCRLARPPRRGRHWLGLLR
mmetsp:Transcript_64818/g.200714  ORF Transcript_64818/g.200714 Transcript_64818/m.200714 type:complete len:203 (-) Transcript_64818:1082-1690(-)